MRIVGGHHRGRRLVAPKGDRTRPTSDRAREAIFDILFDVRDLAFLDLFAGTGAVGLEALSRGARRAVFAETDRAALESIEANLERLDLSAKAEVVRLDAARAVTERERRGETFDVVFADPPWDRVGELIPKLLAAVPAVLAEGGRFILEHDARTPPPDPPPVLATFDRRKYGDTALAFYRRRNE